MQTILITITLTILVVAVVLGIAFLCYRWWHARVAFMASQNELISAIAALRETVQSLQPMIAAMIRNGDALAQNSADFRRAVHDLTNGLFNQESQQASDSRQASGFKQFDPAAANREYEIQGVMRGAGVSRQAAEAQVDMGGNTRDDLYMSLSNDLAGGIGQR